MSEPTDAQIAIPDLDRRLQQAGEKALQDYCTNEDENGIDFDACTCDTCLVREVLSAAWPLVEEYVDARIGIALSRATSAPIHRSEPDQPAVRGGIQP